MHEAIYDQRRQRLSENLMRDGVDALIASTPETMGYLHGFHEGGHERLLILCLRSNGEERMIAPALSLQQATRAGVADVRTWEDGEDPIALFKELARDWDLAAAVLAVDNDLEAAKLLAMQEALPAALFKPAQAVLSTLMRSKGPEELDAMLTAARIADAAFERALPQLEAGQTELGFAQILMGQIRELGGTPTFCIVAAGPNGAEPHHLTDETVIGDGDVVVIDFGCSVDGYQSDVTRTVCCGRATEEAKEVYRTVWNAHRAARAEIRPGQQCQCVDRAAREVIELAGRGKFFNHRTGHGIGLRTHEEPNIVEGNSFELEIGNCFSIEPGIYIPGQFGVRIENIVTVTDDGHLSQNSEPPPELLEI